MTTQRDSTDIVGDADVETGLAALLQRSLLSSLWGRRAHGVSRGSSVEAGEFGAAYLEEANDYSADVIACTRDICTYIYETHGRFSAHTDTIHVPGVWLQTHHLEHAYYEKLHDQRWHPNGNA